ncbi:MAG TPA: isoprenylcysteine carboxylmethyltransferase family protein [Candidatus Limnocylindrales bacterium]
MTVELAARALVLACALSLLAVGMGVLAFEELSRRPEPVERERGPLALVNFVGIIGFIVVAIPSAVAMVATLQALAEPADAAIRLVGIALLLASGLFEVWGIRSMGRQMASAAEVRPDTVLVTGGAFGVVRHPLYLSVLLLWAGGALSLLSWAMAVAWLLLVPAFVARARVEERLLSRHFGEAYSAYAARVPMLLPGFRSR